MSATEERRAQDLAKLRGLARKSEGKIVVELVSGIPINEIRVGLRYTTAGSASYPVQKTDNISVEIRLPSKYPFQEPLVSLSPPVYHPNVYSSGQVCMGVKWIPTQGLDLLLERIIRIIVFDQSVLNEQSPANRAALDWYRNTKRQFPSAFPTDIVNYSDGHVKSTIRWSEMPSSNLKVVSACPSCGTRLRLDSGQSGTVRCPQCSVTFRVKT